MLYEVLLVAYLIVALLLIGFVLIQQGKGADMGASFGAGGSNTVFGSSGSGNFMTRTTGILATLFFGISLSLGNITANRDKAADDFEFMDVPVTEQQAPGDADVPVSQDSAPASDVPAANGTDNESDVPN